MKNPLVLSLLVVSAFIRVSAEEPLAPMASWTKDPSGVSVKLSSGTLRLSVCNDRIIRVQYATDGPIKPLPDIIQSKHWGPVSFEVTEEPEILLLKTKSVTASIGKSDGLLSFADAAGHPFLAEPAAGSRTVRQSGNGTPPWKIQQSFAAAPDEFLYGMGQYQEGVWNWRGMPLELRQQNTQIVVPFLVSSRGYGVLWNNASWSFFNPCDEEIPLSGKTGVTSPEGPRSTEELSGAIKPANPKGIAAPKAVQHRLTEYPGMFTPKESGPHVFLVTGSDRSQEISLRLDDRILGGITNMWTPYAISGEADLKAGVPVKLSVRSKSDSVRLWVRPKGDRTVFRSTQGDLIDYTVFFGPGLEQVIAGYREATGTAPLLPRWAYGFWQCRERYGSSKDLLEAVDGYRSRHIPMDLIVQDWQYWGKYGWGAYQWDERFYPDPKALIQGLHDRHARFMISVWPNPKGKAGNAIQGAKGFVNGVYDATNPDLRKLRWKFLDDAFFSAGTDAWWQDAAEPMDDGNPIEGTTLYLGKGSLWRNAYPFFHSECLYDGQRASDPGKRVCNLTRSAYLGQQRYGTVTWSGDIKGDWTTFRRQIPAGLNLCMAGIPYWTTDCGGFFRPRDEYKSRDYNELQARWFEWSTFCPVLRIHGYQTKTEFWNWLPETQRILADYDMFRYRMLPYTYSEAWRVTSEGSTMMRALALDFREDPKALTISDEHLFGAALLVAPVTVPKAAQRDVYLPKGAGWIDFWTGEALQGGVTVQAATPVDRVPLFAKSGSILPLGPVMEWSDEKPCDPIELRVYPGADGALNLYEDSGDGYDYEKGARSVIPISWNEAGKKLTIGTRQGSFPGMLAKRTFHIVWVGRDHGTGMTEAKPDQVVSYDGTEVLVTRP